MMNIIVSCSHNTDYGQGQKTQLTGHEEMDILNVLESKSLCIITIMTIEGRHYQRMFKFPRSMMKDII